MSSPINWRWVAQAVENYVFHGYSYVEAPWLVKPEALKVTLPDFKSGIQAWHPTMELGYLVGSAEQSFIQMMLDGMLPSGKYVAAGPCFRDDETDDWHSQTFFKVELIDVNAESKDITKMVKTAKSFMESLYYISLDVMETETGLDLAYRGIEVGSYGYREHKDFRWIYGTGLALPRFSKALVRLSNE